MSSNAYKLILRAVFVICAAAVMLSALPHHHHNGSEAVCFNLTHCFAHSDNHDSCCDHHDHCSSEQSSESEPASCHLKIDVAEISSQLSKQTLLPPVQLQTIVIEPLELLAAIDCPLFEGADRTLMLPDPALRIVRYIARALPCRASTLCA